MKTFPEEKPGLPTKHWTCAEAEGAERMRQAKLRRQYIRASHKRRGVERKGVPFLTALQRLFLLSLEKPGRLFGFLNRPKKLPLPERL